MVREQVKLATKGLDLCFFGWMGGWVVSVSGHTGVYSKLVPIMHWHCWTFEKLEDNDKDEIIKYKRKSCGGGGSQRGVSRMREIICQLSGKRL